MRVLKSKRGVDAIGMIIKTVIALLVLIIIIYIVRRVPGMYGAASDCGNYGSCVPGGQSCSEGYFSDAGKKCPMDGEICCVPLESRTSEVIRFSTAERQALVTPIFLSVGKDPKPVNDLKFKEGQKYDLELKFNDKLQAKSFGPVAVFLTNSKEPGKIYASKKFYTQAQELSGESTSMLTYEGGVDTVFGPSWKLQLSSSPSLKDTYKRFTLNVIVIDAMKIRCKSKQGKDDEWVACLKSDLNTPLSLQDVESAWTDKTYWLGGKTYPVNIQRLVEVSGLSAQWVGEDTITVTVSDPDLDKVGVALISGDEIVGLDQVIDKCIQKTVVPEITNIVGTTIDTSGIPLNLNIGGFRIPTSSSQLKYIVDRKKITLAKGKADIKIDKATMLKTFYEEGAAGEIALTGSNSFLCVKAQSSKNPERMAHGLSETPLKVDVLPPDVTNDDIKIVYPEITINTPQLAQLYPSMAGQSHFYQQYPRVIIACRDLGQSGCSNYDYYLKTGNYIDLQVNAGGNVNNSLVIGLSALVLQQGLNRLFSYLATKDPLDTICPPIFSTSEFRQNTRPTINIRARGEGIICIRVKDKAGNAVMLWKEIWNPQELVDKVAAEVTDEVTN